MSTLHFEDLGQLQAMLKDKAIVFSGDILAMLLQQEIYVSARFDTENLPSGHTGN